MTGLGDQLINYTIQFLLHKGMVMTVEKPKPWKHKYVPVRHDTEMVARMRNLIGATVAPPMMTGYQDRVKAALAVREALAEYIELTWEKSPYDFVRMMNTPWAARFLMDKPALLKLLADMKDLGVFRHDSALMYSKRKFMDFIDRCFEEVVVE